MPSRHRITIERARGLPPVDARRLRRVVHGVLEAERSEGPWEVSVVLTGDARILALNSQYRNRGVPTDVLAFSMTEGMEFPLPAKEPRLLGDVVISLDTAQRQASQRRATLEEEVALLLIHGMLHLLGYDDSTSSSFLTMKKRQEDILNSLVDAGLFLKA